MGFSLKKTVKKATNIVKNVVKKPQNLLFPTTLGLTDGLLQASGKTEGLFGAKEGETNPYGRPDLAYLWDTSRLDPLKDSTKFDFLKTNAKASADALRAPSNTFAERYKPPPGTSDSLFNEFVGNINAPSSVDAVRGEVEGDRMRQLLSDIDDDTRASLAGSEMDFNARGLGGAGMMSDIEANALAQTRGDAAKIKAGTRTEYAGKELDRLKAREEALREAYGARYGAGVETDARNADIFSKGALADKNDALAAADLLFKGDTAFADTQAARDSLYAQLLNSRDLGAAGIASNMFNAGEDRRIASKEPSIFDKILNGISIGI